MFRTILKITLLAVAVPAGAAMAAPVEEIRLERTGCLGPCPIYTVTLRSDGSVSFDGRDNVQRKGKATASISKADWDFLLASVQRANFFALRNSYASREDGCTEVWTDNPSQNLTIKRGAEHKQVSYDQGCRGPQELATLAWLGSTVDQVAGTRRWIGSR